MDAWVWFVIGVLLLVCEVLVPSGFFLLILGISGLVVGAVTLMGLISSWMAQAGLFCIVAVVLWLVFAEKLQRLLSSKEQGYAGVVGQTARATEVIAPGRTGQGELWGTTWKFKNVGESLILAGGECVVDSSDGITLDVKIKR